MSRTPCFPSVAVVAAVFMLAPASHAALGAPCTSDADCAAGPEICLTSDSNAFGPGGPAGGFCSVECSADSSVCSTLDVGAECLLVEEASGDAGAATAWCVPDCTTEEPDTAKCGTRGDVACFRIESGTTEGTCQPLCNDDSDCGDRVCDGALGLCVDELAQGDRAPIGSACSAAGSPGQCSGSCEELTAGFSVCTALCVLGSDACPESGNVDQNPAFCLLPGDPDLSHGDFGYCLQACDCNDQCTHPEAVCVDLGAAGLEATGFRGACLPRGMAGGGEGITCEADEPPPAPDPPNEVEPETEETKGCACRAARRGNENAFGYFASFVAVLVAVGRRAKRRTCPTSQRRSAAE